MLSLLNWLALFAQNPHIRIDTRWVFKGFVNYLFDDTFFLQVPDTDSGCDVDMEQGCDEDEHLNGSVPGEEEDPAVNQV